MNNACAVKRTNPAEPLVGRADSSDCGEEGRACRRPCGKDPGASDRFNLLVRMRH